MCRMQIPTLQYIIKEFFKIPVFDSRTCKKKKNLDHCIFQNHKPDPYAHEMNHMGKINLLKIFRNIFNKTHQKILIISIMSNLRFILLMTQEKSSC